MYGNYKVESHIKPKDIRFMFEWIMKIPLLYSRQRLRVQLLWGFQTLCALPHTTEDFGMLHCLFHTDNLICFYINALRGSYSVGAKTGVVQPPRDGRQN